MIHKLFLLLAISAAGVSYAQYSSSPFSSQGLGEAGGLEDAQFGGIGNCRTAVMDSSTVNFYNPSSYAYLSKGQPLFSVGMSSRFSAYSAGDLSSNGRVIQLNQIAMAIPFAKRFGMAFGLQPFSRKGYEITQNEIIGSDEFRYTYLGNGSTQQVFGGFAANVISTQRHQLGLGINYAFIFGSVVNERRSELLGSDPTLPGVGGVDQESYRVHSGYVSLGMNYNIKFDNDGKKQLKLAAVYNPEQKLAAHRDYYLFYATTDVSNQSTYAVLDSIIDDKGSITYPASSSFGFSYTFRPNAGLDYKHKSIYQIAVYGDLTSTMWKSYSTNFANGHQASVFENSYRFSLGAQFTPNFNSYDRSVDKNYLSKIRYRAGGYIGTLPNVQDGTQLSEYGLTVGFGLPIASQKTNSSFNFSMQYGERGNGASNGINEQFVSVNFGVILAPANYDKWFKKTKLD